MTEDEFEEKAAAIVARVLSENMTHEEMIIFSKQDAQTLTRVAKFVRDFEGLLRMSGFLGSTLKWIVFFIGAMTVIKAGFFDWLTANIGGGK